MANQPEAKATVVDPSIMTVGKHAHDPMENFKKYPCPECKRADWDAKSVMFVMDHQAHALNCNRCKKTYFIHIGLSDPMPAPEGWASSAGDGE